jgi:hypothetical protein|tara:strand:- start:211 stop:387 length:177 start_codon:yes stop_codon:yes gene_type:complete
MSYTDIENEMLEVYANARLDGMSRIESTMFLFELGYKPTHKTIEAIKTHDKDIFAFSH